MRRRLASLVGRVALASAAAAALGGSVAALSAGFAARRLVGAHEEAALLAAAREVVGELDEDQQEERERAEHGAARPLAARLAHELDDLHLRSARAAIRGAGRLLAGDAALPALAPNTCALRQGGAPVRLCSVPFGALSLTLAVDAAGERSRDALLVRALWIGVLSGALLGGAFSSLIARLALAPLSRLRDRVRAVRPEAPEAAGLRAPLAQRELEELRAAIASLVDRLADALSHAQAFAAEAAHELRTPLTVLGGELELLEGGAHDGAAPAVARARRQVADLVELVQRLLVLARPLRAEQGGELVDLADVVGQVQSALAPEARARLRAQVADDVLVRGDASLLRAMLANALDNALKFSSGAVELRVTQEGGEAQLQVIDAGPGIAEAERERVFAPFYRSAAARAGGTEGHGLGLALIARVAEVHGGCASFAPVSAGSQLRIHLPAWTPTRRADATSR